MKSVSRRPPAVTSGFKRRASAIGTGPLKRVEWVKGDRVILEKNPRYRKEETLDIMVADNTGADNTGQTTPGRTCAA